MDLSTEIDNENIGLLSCSKLPMIFETIILEQLSSNELILKNTVHFDFISTFIKSTLFTLTIGNNVFEASTIKPYGRHLLFAFERIVDLEEKRATQRINVHGLEHHFCQVLNPFDERTYVRKNLVNMSEGGLAVESMNFTKLFVKDIEFEQIIVYEENKEKFKSKARVVYNKQKIKLNGQTSYMIGLEFKKNRNQSIESKN